MDISELDNSLKLGFIHKTGSEYVCIHLKGIAGSNLENTGNIGVAHLLEHMLVSRGPQGRGIMKIGILSRDSVMYGYKCLKKDLPVILDYIRRLLSREEPIPEDIQTFKDEVYPEIFRHLNTPEKYIIRLVNQTMFLPHRINSLNTGSIEDVQKITCNQIADFYQKYYVPSNFCVLLAGDLEKSDRQMFIEVLSQIIHKKSGKLNANPIFKPGVVLNPVKQVNVPGAFMKINFPGYSVINHNKYCRLLLTGIIGKIIKEHLAKQFVVKFRCEEFNSISYGFTDLFIWTADKNWEVTYKRIEKCLNCMSLNPADLEFEKNDIQIKIGMYMDKLTNLTDYYSDILLAGNQKSPMRDEKETLDSINIEDVRKELDKMISDGPKVTVLY